MRNPTKEQQDLQTELKKLPCYRGSIADQIFETEYFTANEWILKLQDKICSFENIDRNLKGIGELTSCERTLLRILKSSSLLK